MASSVAPRRLALRFQPPGIIVEYAREGSFRSRLFHHEIDMQNSLPSSRDALTDAALSTTIEGIIQQHAAIFGKNKVARGQLLRLVRKLAERVLDAKAPMQQCNSPLVALPQADYNRVSETMLRQVKSKMDVVFRQNLLRPGDPGYQYDKQVEFKPAEEASDWDE